MPNPMVLERAPLRAQGGTGKEEPEFQQDEEEQSPDRTEDEGDGEAAAEGRVKPLPEEAAGE
jgi:hypothetical protein